MAKYNHRALCVFAICGAALYLLGQGSSTRAADANFYKDVSSEAVRCISDNIDAYRQTGRPIIVINPDLCPETDLFAGSKKGLSNMLPGKPFYEKGDQEPAKKRSPSVVYTQKQLGCLATQVAKGPLSALPKSPCANQ
tara:strand:- start:1673 stop:2086 length:414 start_codon:yes stop_codon:yes gene_type:complete